MDAKIGDLQRKEVVNVKDGAKIGFVDDVVIDVTDAKVKALVVYGRLRWFGLLGREADVVIPWCDIEIIGEDAILVSSEQLPKEAPPRSKWWQLWNN